MSIVVKHNMLKHAGCEKGVVRKTSGPQREEEEDFMKLHNEELNDTQYSLTIVLVVK
jgi:hypothetical protein